MSEPRRPGGKSNRYSLPRGEWENDTQIDPPQRRTMPGVVAPSPPPSRKGAPAGGIEIVLVRDDVDGLRAEGPWRAIEIWTSNNVYALDARLVCFEIWNRATRKREPRHPFLGARLVGGKKGKDGTMEITFPYPTAGTEAVFQVKHGKQGRHGNTSEVQRVVVRVRVTTIETEPDDLIWQEITTGMHQLGDRDEK